MTDAVLSRRDGALELVVLQRVGLGLHRQTLHVGIERGPLRDGPGQHDAPVLQAEVVVQVPGAVLLDDGLERASSPARAGLRGRLLGDGAARAVVPGAMLRHGPLPTAVRILSCMRRSTSIMRSTLRAPAWKMAVAFSVAQPNPMSRSSTTRCTT
jgi:hypothetical protein